MRTSGRRHEGGGTEWTKIPPIGRDQPTPSEQQRRALARRFKLPTLGLFLNLVVTLPFSGKVQADGIDQLAMLFLDRSGALLEKVASRMCFSRAHSFCEIQKPAPAKERERHFLSSIITRISSALTRRPPTRMHLGTVHDADAVGFSRIVQRSLLADKFGLSLLAAPGTDDPHFRPSK